MTRIRGIADLRGRIVRKVALHAGTARQDDLLAAMAEAGEFNRQFPEIAIPAPIKVLGVEYAPACSNCRGEGSEELVVGGSREEKLCERCQGSGWQGIIGVADDARAV